MEMEILIYIILSLVLAYVTLCVALIGLLGDNLSPLSYKHCGWYLPLVGMIAWGWKVLLSASPFS